MNKTVFSMTGIASWLGPSRAVAANQPDREGGLVTTGEVFTGTLAESGGSYIYPLNLVSVCVPAGPVAVMRKQ